MSNEARAEALTAILGHGDGAALVVPEDGLVLTHRQLLTEVWGPKAVQQSQYLRVHIAHLRDKIENNPARPEMIVTESGIGYRFLTM